MRYTGEKIWVAIVLYNDETYTFWMSLLASSASVPLFRASRLTAYQELYRLESNLLSDLVNFVTRILGCDSQYRLCRIEVLVEETHSNIKQLPLVGGYV